MTYCDCQVVTATLCFCNQNSTLAKQVLDYERDTLLSSAWHTGIKFGLLTTPDLNVNGKLYWKEFKKLKMELLHDPAISLLGIYLNKTKTLIWKKMHPDVHWSIIYNKEGMKANSVLISRWTDFKQDVVCVKQSRMLLLGGAHPPTTMSSACLWSMEKFNQRISLIREETQKQKKTVKGDQIIMWSLSMN